ncbi:MAG: hypothetical protein GY946_10720, partial [bacterium]|nr:hypothetical protein [bacterium]
TESSHQLPIGGSVNLTLNEGASNYLALLLGSLGGTRPGVGIAPGLTLSLNPDSYFNTLLTAAPISLSGPTTWTVSMPSPNIPAFNGLQFHHAYLLLNQATGLYEVSNAVPTNLVP